MPDILSEVDEAALFDKWRVYGLMPADEAARLRLTLDTLRTELANAYEAIRVCGELGGTITGELYEERKITGGLREANELLADSCSDALLALGPHGTGSPGKRVRDLIAERDALHAQLAACTRERDEAREQLRQQRMTRDERDAEHRAELAAMRRNSEE